MDKRRSITISKLSISWHNCSPSTCYKTCTNLWTSQRWLFNIFKLAIYWQDTRPPSSCYQYMDKRCPFTIYKLPIYVQVTIFHRLQVTDKWIRYQRSPSTSLLYGQETIVNHSQVKDIWTNLSIKDDHSSFKNVQYIKKKKRLYTHLDKNYCSLSIYYSSRSFDRANFEQISTWMTNCHRSKQL